MTVSLLWPGTLSLPAARFALAGTSMFALLAAAAAGDSGAAVMPWAVGLIADRAVALPAISGDTPGLRWGLLAATVCPVLMAAVLAWLRHESQTTTM